MAQIGNNSVNKEMVSVESMEGSTLPFSAVRCGKGWLKGQPFLGQFGLLSDE